MPTRECLTYSKGTAEEYRLVDGRYVEIRNGCVICQETRYTIAGSDQAADFLLAHGDLSKAAREDIDYHKRFAWPAAGAGSRVPNVQKRYWALQTQKERENN